MNNIRKAAEVRFTRTITNSVCKDKKLGRLLPRYIDDDLAAAEAESFEVHAHQCGACRVAISNWRDLSSAVHYFGIDPLLILRRPRPLAHKG